jgi:U3 small nucleolar RNA-associated protein 20
MTVTGPAASYKLLKRVLTALIHHTRGSEQFKGIADVFVAEYLSLLECKLPNKHPIDTLKRVMRILTVSLSVRQGSRMSYDHCLTLLRTGPKILELLSAHPEDSSFATACLTFVTANVTAASTSRDMGSSPAPSEFKSFLKATWEVPRLGDTDFGIMLHGSLASLGWCHWKAIGAESTLRASYEILASTQDATCLLRQNEVIKLLGVLARDGCLSQGDIVWKECLNRWTRFALSRWRDGLQGSPASFEVSVNPNNVSL